MLVSSNYFAMLGFAAAIGSGFTPEQDRPGQWQVVLLSEAPEASRGPILTWAQSHGVPEISVPRRVFKVGQIPVLGTGKSGILCLAQARHTLRKSGKLLALDAVASGPEAAVKIGARVVGEARNHGVILRPLGSVIVLMPPLSITSDEIALLVDVTARAIATVTS